MVIVSARGKKRGNYYAFKIKVRKGWYITPGMHVHARGKWKDALNDDLALNVWQSCETQFDATCYQSDFKATNTIMRPNHFIVKSEGKFQTAMWLTYMSIIKSQDWTGRSGYIFLYPSEDIRFKIKKVYIHYRISPWLNLQEQELWEDIKTNLSHTREVGASWSTNPAQLFIGMIRDGKSVEGRAEVSINHKEICIMATGEVPLPNDEKIRTVRVKFLTPADSGHIISLRRTWT